jgi:hypothetical protein
METPGGLIAHHSASGTTLAPTMKIPNRAELAGAEGAAPWDEPHWMLTCGEINFKNKYINATMGLFTNYR